LEGAVLLPNYAESFVADSPDILFQPVQTSAAVISEAQARMN
jgi:hypothetical protein